MFKTMTSPTPQAQEWGLLEDWGKTWNTSLFELIYTKFKNHSWMCWCQDDVTMLTSSSVENRAVCQQNIDIINKTTWQLLWKTLFSYIKRTQYCDFTLTSYINSFLNMIFTFSYFSFWCHVPTQHCAPGHSWWFVDHRLDTWLYCGLCQCGA